jgi:hypothetical protein
MTAIAEDARVYRWRGKKEGVRACLEREIRKDKGGTCLKCSESDKRENAVSTVSRIR